jgi:hypothetical protein
MGVMAIDQPDEEKLTRAYSVIENTPEVDKVIERLREILDVDHVVYSLARPPAGLYIHPTYPASWIKRYMNRGYTDVDPIAREGSQRCLPFDWNELTILSSAESLFLADAHSHGIGPHGFSVPLFTKYGHKLSFRFRLHGLQKSGEVGDRYSAHFDPGCYPPASQGYCGGLWRGSTLKPIHSC